MNNIYERVWKLLLDTFIAKWQAITAFVIYSYFMSDQYQCPSNSSDRQDKYVIGPICLISSRTEMSDVASNTMYTMYTHSQTDICLVVWNDFPNRTECPMKFKKVSRTLNAI